jgi:AcrR family transcriptional regulator
MPKALSENERIYLKERLVEQAKRCFSQFGLRKTTVDELVRSVGIPKGTFYLLFPSKEALFFEAYRGMHDELQDAAVKGIAAFEGNLNVDHVTDLVYAVFQQVKSSSYDRFIMGGDLELLLQKIPQESVAQLAQQDTFSMEGLIRMLPVKHSDERIRAFSASMQAAFFALLHKQEIGEDVFDDAILIMIRGIVSQLFEEDVT